MTLEARARPRGFAPYLVALGIYLSSRLLIALAMTLSPHLVPQPRDTPFWYEYLARWDAGWYLAIAQHGYGYNGDDHAYQTVVFYPLYPVLSGLISKTFGIDLLLVMLVIANAAALAAALLLFQLTRRYYDDMTAYCALAALSFYPGSVFLSAAYTELMALMLILGCFLLLRQERFVAASLAAGIALGARSTGLVLAPVILWELWRRYRDAPRRLLALVPLCMILATSGLLLYMLYLGLKFGNPLAFMSAQAAWRRSSSGLLENLISGLTLQPFYQVFMLRNDGPIDCALFTASMALIVAGWKRVPTSFGLFALGVLLLPYFTVSMTDFRSMARFIVLAFPVFIIVAIYIKDRPYLRAIYIGASAVSLFVASVLFAQWFWIG